MRCQTFKIVKHYKLNMFIKIRKIANQFFITLAIDIEMENFLLNIVCYLLGKIFVVCCKLMNGNIL